MALTRRNAIVGLGALVGGTGALAASGAFTTVEAERDVSIETAGDGEALVEISIADGFVGVSDGGGDVVDLNFDDLNQNAETRFDGALVVELGDGVSGTYEVTISTDTGGVLEVEGDPETIEGGDPQAAFDLVIDLLANDETDFDESGQTITLTVDEQE